MIAASAGRTVTRSASNPNGREPPPLGRPSRASLLRLAPQPARHVVGALGGHGAHDPRVEPPVVRREVDVAGDGRERDTAGAVAYVEELLELARLAVQPVEMPDDDGVGRAAGDVGEHPPVFGARLAVVGADVVVDVALGDGPAARGGELLAVGDLAADAERVAVAVLARCGRRCGATCHARDIIRRSHGRASPRPASARRRRRRAPRRRSCGAASGTAARSISPPAPCRPAIECSRVTSIASCARERRQQSGQPPREHRLAGAGRAVQEQVVAAGRGDLERGDQAVVAADVGEVGLASSVGSGPVGRGGGAGARSPRRTSTASCRCSTPSDVERADERRLARPRARQQQPGEAVPRRAASATASAPRTARTSPISDSSPTTAQPATASASSWPLAARMRDRERRGRSPDRPCAGRPAQG